MNSVVIVEERYTDKKNGPMVEKPIGFLPNINLAAGFINSITKTNKESKIIKSYNMNVVPELDFPGKPQMSEDNKILDKLIEQFGRGVYTILNYDLVHHIERVPSAIIEHEDGTPTCIYYDKEKGEWQ